MPAPLAAAMSASLSPIMIAKGNAPPALDTSSVMWRGSGLWKGKVSRPAFASKSVAMRSPDKSFVTSLSSLFVQRSEPCASATQLICSFKKAGEQPRFDCDMLFVMLHKPLREPLHLRRVGSLSGRGERLFEHHLRSIPDAPPDRLPTRGPEAFSDQGGVRRVDEIGRSVGNRPIQVENDRGTMNGLPPNSVRLGRQRRAPTTHPVAGGPTRSFATKSSHVLANPRQI